ncbi:transient receptor potential cation channel subfamily M member 2 isoform X1 [Diceros bicornis minor]|uniref:transient receptor potential cation channel subfamily M member 2 isoform X1 n=4 Tax=Diceros bicornis minor TaxID=77932 RepID=UPI0026F2EBCD|nr:transient receptor potential cation channel subfamily M member 2 isoform X1 [Diceros bicornis minor]XP_058379214.1 transient receptor potential cation channel subfamily M member 2 isoform X1 [Diceros bicornis minor]XP_058379215.1 transient receptor potential cation channel subfamily M member 2 isoform X1 [Diceros bicornis minor]XP_058379217.1 transient receptor potential cation channel subfamily M member 2 isoform X1 [Diceros bicornis minor]XP_058379218.1 transient receptor potential cation 
MEPLAPRRAGSKQEEGFGGQPRRVAELVMLPDLRRSSSGVSKNKKSQYLLSNCEEQENSSSWILENIKKKECVYFVKSSTLSDAGKVVCECGYPREQHLAEAMNPYAFQGEEWDPKKHVKEMPTDAFGDIAFRDVGQKVGKYVRLSQDTPSHIIYHLITQHWDLDIPNLLISVTGGAKDFNMKPRLKSIFRRGLVKVAHTTGAWIITGGTHAGVMKQVGEAVRDFSLSSSRNEGELVTIGIATWGAVHNRRSLIHPTLLPSHLQGGFCAEYVVDEEGQGHLTCLDSNHSHFILVDDGTHGCYGVEIALRTKLEKFISEQTKERGGVAIKIPIVCVVLEGGPGTLQTIYNAITNGTPCVIVEGSGRVADVIAQVASLPISEITISLIQQKLSMFFQEMFETFTESRIVEWTKKIQDIVRKRQLLTIFREGKDGQQDVDVAILQALLKASRSHDHFGHENWDHQLKLAVAWNRVDIARSEIFTDEWQWKPSELHTIMTAALISNKPEFVKLFLENGLQLKEFVTWDTLSSLYRNLDPSCLFQYKLQKVLAEDPEHPTAVPADPRVHMHFVAQVLRELLGDFTQPLYPRFRPYDQVRLTLRVPHGKPNDSSGDAAFKRDPARDLLIWAIVQNRRKLAEIIWDQSQECIAAALACTKILKELSKEEEDTDSLEEMLALADEYEHRAIGVFTECYRKDEERAQKLLVRVSQAWGTTTCLQLALEAKDMKFMSHGGVQAFLTKVWWGQLCVDNGLWRVILCMLAFPLLCTHLISFREKRLQAVRGLLRVRAFFSAPVVIFHVNILSYFLFLCLFSYVLMVDFQPTPSHCEYVIYFWLFSLTCEELRQLFYDPDGCGLRKRAFLYFNDFWNKLDIIAILLFIVGLTCRLIPALLYTGRVLLSLDFIMFCLRLMHIFTVSKTLGPKIIIVKRMMKDVFFFIFLLAVWVVSFGVAKQAILIHNESRVDWIFRGVIYQSYLTIFGQMPAYIDGVNFSLDDCSPNGTEPYKPKCPESDTNLQAPAFPEWLTVILLCLYLLFTNILLLNLLIAMFNYTFQQVQEHTDQIWKFQRHDLIEEYHNRPPAPPPFIVLSHLHLVVKRVILKIPAKRHKQLKNKLEESEEAALLFWETYLKENYLQNQQYQQQQRPEQKIQDISNKVDAMVDLLEMEHVKRSGSVEQRLASLEEQVTQTARALHWIVKTLKDGGFGLEADVPTLASQKASEGQDPELHSRQEEEDPGDAHHVNARHLLYPSSLITRFPVPNEKVPWETEFLIYNPPFYTAERKDKGVVDPVGSALEPLSGIRYNAVDGPVDRRSSHGPYAVRDGLPLNPMGRTGLRGRGALRYFGPNHSLQPVVTRWRRNQDGAICRKSIKKMLEVLVMKLPISEHWALPGGSQEPGEMLPRKLKQVLQREFWSSFQSLLTQGVEVYKGYVDDPRNTDNAWIETVAVSVHFADQNDVELTRLDSHLKHHDPKISVRWQVVDKRIPLYANHKTILQKVATLFGAYY